MNTQSVVERHLEAFLSGDVDKCMADYADDIILLRQHDVIRGLPSLRVLFEDGFKPNAIFEPGNGFWTLDSLICEGEYAWMTWHHRWGATDIPFGADAFVVRDGKIVMQTGAWHERPVD